MTTTLSRNIGTNHDPCWYHPDQFSISAVLSIMIGPLLSYLGITKHWSQSLGVVMAGIATSVATRRSPTDATMTALDG